MVVKLPRNDLPTPPGRITPRGLSHLLLLGSKLVKLIQCRQVNLVDNKPAVV